MFDRKKYEKALQLAEMGKYDEALDTIRKIKDDDLKSKSIKNHCIWITKERGTRGNKYNS